MTTSAIGNQPLADELSQEQVEQLRGLGFSDDEIKVFRRLIASIAGLEKTGKTHFACTAPGPIMYFNIDIGAEGVVNKFQDDKRIFRYDVRVPKGATKDVYQAMWLDLKHRLEVVYSIGVGTVIIDTGTEAFELARLAHFGKLTQVMPHNYVEVNSEWREMMRTAYDSPMNTIYIHKMKSKWLNGNRTGEYELAGFGEMGYLSQVNITTFREDNTDSSGSQFGMIVKDCRQNPNLNGTVLRGPMCDFNFLLNIVHPSKKQ